jgi:hypothetical protein
MRYSILILTAIVLVACETDIDNPDWPRHDAKLVITANLRVSKDSVFVFCRVSRTMSLGEKFSVEASMVDDADVHILNDGKPRSIPFRPGYSFNISNDANYMAVFRRGDFTEYTLTVRKGDLYVRTTLDLPDIPLRFDTVSIKRIASNFGYYERECSFILTTPVNRLRYDIHLEEQRPDGAWAAVDWGPWSLIDGSVSGSFAGVFRYGARSDGRKARYTLRVLSPEYRDYENSRWSSDHSGSIFEPDSKNPAFNVTGDGIGFFWYEMIGEPVEIDY